MKITAYTTCPECAGAGHRRIILPAGVQELPCQTCRATGDITLDYAWRIKAGKALRRQREKAHLGVRQAAKDMGITVRFLQRLENGGAPKIVYHAMCKRLGINLDQPARQRELA